MFKKSALYQAVLSLLAVAGATQVMAAPLELADTPPGTGYKPPKPNVILSLDNSGSMSWDDRGCHTADSAAAYGIVVQGGAIYAPNWPGYTTAQWVGWNCPYELPNGQFRTRAQVRAWSDFQEYTINGRSYLKADTPVATQSRMQTLKASLPQALNNVVADGSVRLAWQALHNTTANSGYSVQLIQRGALNAMRSFEGQHRANFNNYLANLVTGGGTPTHRMMRGAHNYMSEPSLGVNSPWAKDPGVTAEPYLGCRRAYHIVLSDGEWNTQQGLLPPEGSQDQDSIADVGRAGNVGGSGQSYDPNADWARVFHGAEAGTLADWAFISWAQDLQPSIPNEMSMLPDYLAAPPTSEHGGVTVPKFWNPRYNPATWQHMITFSIGYGSQAYAWGARPRFDQTWLAQPNNVLADNYAGDFNQLYQRSATWPVLNVGTGQNSPGGSNRQSDLWHMALNSRGKFYPVDNGERLTAAFTEIFKRISADTQPGTTATAASGSNNVFTDVGLFTSTFDSARAWRGHVEAWTLSTEGQRSANAVWGMNGTNPRNTADMLDDRPEAEIANRLILTTNDATQTGVPFIWRTASGAQPLSDAQRAAISGGLADPEGANRVNYLRGSRLLESNTNYRERQSRQGDIVNSSIWYVGKPASGYGVEDYLRFANTTRQDAEDAMIYVGGNDGMLHGFSAHNGEERIAYVPKGLIPGLRELTLPTYGHKFYVDGSPFAGDAEIDGNWKTVLVGTLGAGGRGYFVLDVTNPDDFSASNASSLVMMDKTQIPRSLTGAPDPVGLDPDLGHIFGAPVPHETYPMRAAQVAQMNNGRWAVVLGNGYNSANEQPVLYIQYLDGDKSVHKIEAITAATASGENKSENGLSAPRLVDINGDDRPDVIYAGDLKGNLWKFDVSSSSPSDWGVAFGGQPLFTACRRSNSGQVSPSSCVRQPITVAPTVRAHPAGRGMMVAFGTGRNVTMPDRSTTDTQAIYSVLDNTRYKFRNAAKTLLQVHPGSSADGIEAPQTLSASTSLISQTVSSTTEGGSGESAGTDFWATSGNAVDWSDANTKGWFLNLPASGERLLQTMGFYDGSNILTVNSQVPARGSGDLEDETCSAVPEAGKRYMTMLNIMTGKPPSVQLMDLNGDGLYNGDDNRVSRMSLLPDSVTFVKTGDHTLVSSSGGGKSVPQQNKLALMPIQAMRPSWRQLQ
ncbi:pilus assembly protein PilC [Allofranklinella schreckenbergeri]|uniref:Pilus assembly protein PilC n=1 Tax=Allofranklinella schreckenbergeri TaxID=1076744 RepID=A0A3M6QA51_9BURK|nr:PilC/PilY family type IV pilus protein [Allofranklinella schreckenbergeri]RMW99371.1 pilus assembly protein PilC [Allofranklinella schreckenbergeri]